MSNDFSSIMSALAGGSGGGLTLPPTLPFAPPGSGPNGHDTPKADEPKATPTPTPRPVAILDPHKARKIALLMRRTPKARLMAMAMAFKVEHQKWLEEQEGYDPTLQAQREHESRIRRLHRKGA